MAGPLRGNLRKIALRALLVLAGACAALVVINSFDEELSPEAAAYLAPDKVKVPDARNAYLAMLGIESQPDVRLHEAGRKRLDAMAAAIAADPLLVEVPDFQVEHPLTLSGKYDGCRNSPSCIRDIAADEKAREFVEANSTLLRRYRELLDYPEFSDAVPLSAFGSFPLYPPLLMEARRLFHASVALRLQSAGTARQALAALGRQIEFDRRNLAAAGHSLSKLLFAAFLRDDYLLLSGAMQASTINSGDFEVVRAALVPLTSKEKSLALVLRSEGRQSAETLRRVRQAMLRLRNPHADMIAANPELELRSPFPSTSKAVNFLLAWLYQPNAAVNEWFRLHKAVAALAAEPVAGRLDAARGEDKWIRDFEKDMSPNPFNLAGISAARKLILPGHALRYSFYLDDLDGLVRLVILEAALLRTKPSPSTLAASIGSREELRDPYTGKPMQHAIRRSPSGQTLVDLWFEPVNSSWRQRDFGLGAGKVTVTLGLPAGSPRTEVTR